MTVVPDGPSWQDPNPETGQRKNSRTILAVTAAALAIVVGGALTATLIVTQPERPSTAEIALQSADSVGPGPFTASVALNSRPVNDRSAAEFEASSVSNSDGSMVVAGTTPGLYGGVEGQSSCDAAALANFLSEDQATSEAWASVFGITTSAIPYYLNTLTPVVLTTDTRVTNHSLSDGTATPFESVLQRGTAVLIDSAGVPRVRCKCGNPLGPPASDPLSSYVPTGQEWPTYSDTSVVSVDYSTDVAAGQPIPTTANNATTQQFALRDLDTLDTLVRTVGNIIDTSSLPPLSTPLPDPRAMNLPLVNVAARSSVDLSTDPRSASRSTTLAPSTSVVPSPAAASVTARTTTTAPTEQVRAPADVIVPETLAPTATQPSAQATSAASAEPPTTTSTTPPATVSTSPTQATTPAPTVFIGDPTKPVESFVVGGGVTCTVTSDAVRDQADASTVRCSNLTVHVIKTADLTPENISAATKDGVWTIVFDAGQGATSVVSAARPPLPASPTG